MKNQKCYIIHRIVAVKVQIIPFSPLADYMKSLGRATELSLAAKSVLVEDFGVGCVIHSYGGAHSLSPQTSTSEGWGLLQNQEAVATETTLEPVRRCRIVQGLGEPWSEKERGSGLSGSFEFPPHVTWFVGHWPAFRRSQLLHTEPSHRMGRPRLLLNRGCHEGKMKTVQEI